jgi:hypothetical protein
VSEKDVRQMAVILRLLVRISVEPDDAAVVFHKARDFVRLIVLASALVLCYTKT